MAALRYTSIVLKEPELIIGYDEKSRPVAGVCSACGEEMDMKESRPLSMGETIRWLSDQFQVHVRRKHTN